VALVGTHPAAADDTLTVMLPPSHDTTLYGGSDEKEFGNGAGPGLFAGNNGVPEARRALIEFDLSQGIPPGSTITSVVLHLIVTRAQAGTSHLELHRVTASWAEGATRADGQGGAGTQAAEGDATWNHRVYPSTPWANPGGDYFASPSATATVGDEGTIGEWQDAALADDVQRWLADPTSNFGWIVLSPDGGPAKRFGSREAPSATRPVLIVAFKPPVPAGACCQARGVCGYVLDPGTACVGAYKGAGTTCRDDTCPPPTGACCTRDVTAACSVQTQAVCNAAGGAWSDSAATCDPNPCPVVLTPFVDELPLPAVATPIATSESGAPQYRMSIVQIKQKLHRDLPATTVWGFSDGTNAGGYPGPTIEAKVGDPIDVTWVNDLRDDSGAPLTQHHLHVDTCPHGAQAGPPHAVIHLHGGHVPSDSDGQPDMSLGPGEAATYHYPNQQRAATLWYHDHVLGVTRLDVMMGIAGYYILRDDAEEALGLPSGRYDVPLAIQDRTFSPDGSIQYPVTWQESFFGNTILVNGKVWPTLTVDRAAYRFRILNGSTSRVYTLALDPPLPMVQIAGDGGLLRYGIARQSVTVGPGERTEVVIDFGSPFAAPSITLTNQAPAPYPNGEEQYAVSNVMKFILSPNSGPRGRLPIYLRKEQGALDPTQAIRTRDLSLQRSTDGCDGGGWLINGLRYHDVTELPRLGTTEIWRFINRSGATHTMHMHLVMFEVLDRQKFTITGDEVVPQGTPTPPDPGEAGWKDTVLVPPLQMVRVVTRFEDYVGPYPYHCHMLEHEDHDMMRQFVTQPPCPDAGCPPEGDAGAGVAECEGGADACVSRAGTSSTSGCACDAGRGPPPRRTSLLALTFALIVGASRRPRRARPRRAQGSSARIAGLGAGLLALAATTPSRAATQVLAPVDDTFINSASPGNNNGGSSSLFTGTDGRGGLMRALVRFAMPVELQGRVTVTEAQLRLTVRTLPNGNVGPGTIETLARVTQPWTQGNGVGETSGTFTVGQTCGGAVTGATWIDASCATTSAWTTPGATVAAAASAQADTTGVGAGAGVLWDSATNPAMKSDVQAWIDSPSSNDGWRVASNSEGAAGVAQRFYSAESGATGPSLTVTFSCNTGFVDNGTSCVAAVVPATRSWSIVLLAASLAAMSFARMRPRVRARTI
jgi:spore coat protein A